MRKIVLLSENDTVIETQYVENLEETINVLELTERDYLDVTDIDMPVVLENELIKYDREKSIFNVIDTEIPLKNQTQLDAIEESQLVIMEAIADQYEQKIEQDLIMMESQATIYEMLLEMGGNE